MNQDAFWLVMIFCLQEKGNQSVANLDKEAVQLKIEQLLKEKNHDAKGFRSALESGNGKQRVLEDMTLGNKLRIKGTPTKILNGDLIVGSTPDNILERYLGK